MPITPFLERHSRIASYRFRQCMVRRATARGKFGREDKSAQMYSAFMWRLFLLAMMSDVVIRRESVGISPFQGCVWGSAPQSPACPLAAVRIVRT
jgi:hypothetical protein